MPFPPFGLSLLRPCPAQPRPTSTLNALQPIHSQSDRRHTRHAPATTESRRRYSGGSARMWIQCDSCLNTTFLTQFSPAGRYSFRQVCLSFVCEKFQSSRTAPGKPKPRHWVVKLHAILEKATSTCRTDSSKKVMSRPMLTLLSSAVLSLVFLLFLFIAARDEFVRL